MAEPSKVKYTELKIRENIAEAIAVADVIFGDKSGTLEILGLPSGLNMEDISTFSKQAYTDVESVVDTLRLEYILAKNPKVTLTTTDNKTIDGRLLSDTEGIGVTLIGIDGTLSTFPNREVIKTIEYKEKLRAEPLLKVTYSKENAETQSANITIKHLLSGLSFSNIVYNLDFGGNKLGISPFIYVTNNSLIDFKDVKLTLVMPEKPRPKGDKVTPEVGPMEEYLKRSEDIRVRRDLRAFAVAATPHMRGLRAEGGEICKVSEFMAEEAVPIETIEGFVADVDTEGKYSLSQGENKRARLKGAVIDGCHRTNILLINTAKYKEGGVHYTSIIDAVRLTPNTDLKAGSFYFDGQQLQFPSMKKDQEYELGLRTCRNLEAEVSKEESTRPNERHRPITTTTYNVKLINNTGDEQKVEINIPLDPISRQAGSFTPQGEHVKYELKTIAGEQYYIANVIIGVRGTVEFKFNLKTS